MNIHQNARLTPAGRERLVRLARSGLSPKAVAETMGVCPKTVGKWVARFDDHHVERAPLELSFSIIDCAVKRRHRAWLFKSERVADQGDQPEFVPASETVRDRVRRAVVRLDQEYPAQPARHRQFALPFPKAISVERLPHPRVALGLGPQHQAAIQTDDPPGEAGQWVDGEGQEDGVIADEILLVQQNARCLLDLVREVAGHEGGEPPAAGRVERLEVEQPAVAVTPGPARRSVYPEAGGLERASGRVRTSGHVVMCHF